MPSSGTTTAAAMALTLRLDLDLFADIVFSRVTSLLTEVFFFLRLPESN